MTSGRADFVIEKGTTWRKVITWTQADGGSPINLTGFTARMHIRENTSDRLTIVELTTENGRISLGGVNGQITLLLSDAITSALDGSRGVYDLELISSGGEVTRLIEGKITLRSEVTR